MNEKGSNAPLFMRPFRIRDRMTLKDLARPYKPRGLQERKREQSSKSLASLGTKVRDYILPVSHEEQQPQRNCRQIQKCSDWIRFTTNRLICRSNIRFQKFSSIQKSQIRGDACPIKVTASAITACKISMD